MSGTIHNFRLHSDNGSTHLGGFDLETALQAGVQVEIGSPQKIIRITRGVQTVLENDALRQELDKRRP